LLFVFAFGMIYILRMKKFDLENDFEVRVNSIRASEYLFLRKDVGWGEPELGDIEEAIGKTLHFISMYRDGDIVGAIRIVGDGKLCFYIQDLMVAREYQRGGIGGFLFEKALKFIDENAAFNAFVGLMAAKGVEPLYKKYDFIERPNAQFGAGMIRFWGREGEMCEKPQSL